MVPFESLPQAPGPPSASTTGTPPRNITEKVFHMAQRVPTFRSTRYVAVRGDDRHRLTHESIREARWGDLEGREVTVALIRVKTYEAGTAEAVGRLLADAGAARVSFQGIGTVADRFAIDAERAAVQYAHVVNQ
jgi:hypothetical protein